MIRPRRWLRAPLVHFALLGGALYLGVWATTPAPPPEPIRLSASELSALEKDWIRQTGRPPTKEEHQAILRARADDELLLREARSLGWHRSDPVVQRRLIRNQRFLASDGAPGATTEKSRGTRADDATLLERAYLQGMDRSDIVVRRRLLERMRLTIEANAHTAEPTRADLSDTFARHTEHFLRPARAGITHVFLSRDRRRSDLARDAERLGRRLRRDEPPPEEAGSIGDAFLLSNTLPLSTHDQLAARLGARFADAAMQAPVGRWSGPAASSYGLHFLWVREREAEELPSLDEVESRVRALWLHERERAALRAYLAHLREGVEIRIESAPRRLASE